MPSIHAGFKQGAPGESPADLLLRFGPTVWVDIGLKSRAGPGSEPDLPEKRVKALIDTGAGGDCIDEELARKLRLPIHDEGEISGVGGRHRAFIYTARIYIPGLKKLLFQPFTGVKLYEGEQWHRVILGRSFLRQYKLAYDGRTGEAHISD
jgi:predicted aspartyl protease